MMSDANATLRRVIYQLPVCAVRYLQSFSKNGKKTKRLRIQQLRRPCAKTDTNVYTESKQEAPQSQRDRATRYVT